MKYRGIVEFDSLYFVIDSILRKVISLGQNLLLKDNMSQIPEPDPRRPPETARTQRSNDERMTPPRDINEPVPDQLQQPGTQSNVQISLSGSHSVQTTPNFRLLTIRPGIGIEAVPIRRVMNYDEYAGAYPVPSVRRPADFDAQQDMALAQFRERFQDQLDKRQSSWMAGLMCFGFKEDVGTNEVPIEFIIRCPDLIAAESVMQGATHIASFPIRIVSGTFERLTGPKNMSYTRPLKVGSSIGPKGKEKSGTLGCFFRDVNGRVYALTCEHVAGLNEVVQQPSQPDEVGVQLQLELLKFGEEDDQKRVFAEGFDIGIVTFADPTNDLALVRLNPEHDQVDNLFANKSDLFLAMILEVKALPDTAVFRWVAFAKDDMLLTGQFCEKTVFMCGRTSNFSYGTMHNVKYVARFKDEPDSIVCRIAIESKEFGDFGDSGAAVGVFDNNGQGTIVGILYGAETEHHVSHYAVSLEPFLALQQLNGLHLALV